MALADFVVVGVVCWRDLHRAGALFRIRMFVADDGNFATDDRQADRFPDQVRIPGIGWIDRHRSIAKERLRPRGFHHDVPPAARGGIRLRTPDPGLRTGEFIFQFPQMTVLFDCLHFIVGQRGLLHWAPIHHARAAVDQSGVGEFHEHGAHGRGQAFVHGEAFA